MKVVADRSVLSVHLVRLPLALSAMNPGVVPWIRLIPSRNTIPSVVSVASLVICCSATVVRRPGIPNACNRRSNLCLLASGIARRAWSMYVSEPTLDIFVRSECCTLGGRRIFAPVLRLWFWRQCDLLRWLSYRLAHEVSHSAALQSASCTILTLLSASLAFTCLH